MTRASETPLRLLEPSEVIFEEGDSWDGLYLIKAGQVEIFQRRKVHEVRLGLLHPGEFIGTVTLMTRENRTASARALVATQLQHFNEDVVNQNFVQAPPWLQVITKDILTRLKHVNAMLVESRQETRVTPDWVSCLQHLQQLCCLLLFTSKRKGAATIQSPFRLPLFLDEAEKILNLHSNYLRELFELLQRHHLVNISVIAGEGLCWVGLREFHIRNFLDYAQELIELQTPPNNFVSAEIFSLLQKLLPAVETDRPRVLCTRAELETFFGGSVDIALLQETQFITRQGDGSEEYQINKHELWRVCLFEPIFRDLVTLTPRFLG